MNIDREEKNGVIHCSVKIEQDTPLHRRNFQKIDTSLKIDSLNKEIKRLSAKLSAKNRGEAGFKNRIRKLENFIKHSPRAKEGVYKSKFEKSVERIDELEVKCKNLKGRLTESETKVEKMQRAIKQQLGNAALNKVNYYVDMVY
jgi:uncharacterized coiled-coil DUF342 family protein